jgi:hypothetical protein
VAPCLFPSSRLQQLFVGPPHALEPTGRQCRPLFCSVILDKCTLYRYPFIGASVHMVVGWWAWACMDLPPSDLSVIWNMVWPLGEMPMLSVG